MIAIVFCVFAALAAWDSALSSGSLSGYLNTTEIDSFVSSLGSSISSSTLGTSINNHKITAYLLSENGKIYLGLTSKPTILISAGHTTTQPLSVTMALYILGSFVSSTTADSNYSLFKFLMQSTNIYIVPIINIDAYTNISDSNTLEVFLKNFHDECG